MAIQELEDRVVLTHPQNPKTTTTILKYGATVLSWSVNDKEQLWLSTASKLDGSKPVRGGIPLVFPQFGKKTEGSTKNLVQHGFARSSTWKYLGQVKQDPPTVEFGLTPEQVDPEVFKKWEGENNFSLVLTVALGSDSLSTEIEVLNKGKETFEFNWLFHTYLKISDIGKTQITNVPGTDCYDILSKESFKEDRELVPIEEEYDIIFQDLSDDVVTKVIESGNTVHTVKKRGMPAVNVWNPWDEMSKKMADFEPKDGYKNMLCVEPGYIKEFKKLEAGESWKGLQLLVKN